MVAWVCRTLAAAGIRPAVLMRGYAAGRGDGRSDEARELAARLGEETPILAHPNRAGTGAALLAREPGIGALVLDDGFQHYRLKRDLDVVLIDATRPWGHDRLLPRGMLREPKSALRRADAVVVTRCDLVDSTALGRLDAEIEHFHAHRPAAHTRALWAGVRVGDDRHAVDWLAARRVAGACGVGNPAAFRRMLDHYAGEVLTFADLPDHHAPDREAIRRLLTAARDAGAEAMVVTEKDHVKWIERMAGDPSFADLPPLARPVPNAAFPPVFLGNREGGKGVRRGFFSGAIRGGG
jgi:tetraacyldisaccharide 4'-kinase